MDGLFEEIDGQPSNIARTMELRMGDLDQGFADADIVIDRVYETAMAHQGYIEPHNGTATWKKMLILSKQNKDIKRRVDVMRFRTTEELYDINEDPDCLHNLAQSKEHQNTIQNLRKTLHEWMKKTNDHALVSFEPNNSKVMEAYVQSKQLESDNRRKKNKKASSSKVKKSS